MRALGQLLLDGLSEVVGLVLVSKVESHLTLVGLEGVKVGRPRGLVAELVVDLLVEDEHGAAVEVEYPHEVGAFRVVFDETRHAATPLVPPTEMHRIVSNGLKESNKINEKQRNTH